MENKINEIVAKYKSQLEQKSFNYYTESDYAIDEGIAEQIFDDFANEVLNLVCRKRNDTKHKNTRSDSSVYSKENPAFIRLALYDSPNDPASWVGAAAQIHGDDMYGEFIILETYCTSLSLEEQQNYLPGSFTSAAEWEWNGTKLLVGKQLMEAREIYFGLMKDELEQER